MPETYSYVINGSTTSTLPSQYPNKKAFIDAGGVIVVNNDEIVDMRVDELGLNYEVLPNN